MVENLNIQTVLSPISLTSSVKKAGREKNKNSKRSFEEELKEKKEKKERISVDKQKADEKVNIEKEGNLKEKQAENAESIESNPGKVIDIHI